MGSALTQPLEVLALAATLLALRAALVGFVLLVRGRPAQEIAEQMAVATAAAVPAAALVAIAATVYLLTES